MSDIAFCENYKEANYKIETDTFYVSNWHDDIKLNHYIFVTVSQNLNSRLKNSYIIIVSKVKINLQDYAACHVKVKTIQSSQWFNVL